MPPMMHRGAMLAPGRERKTLRRRPVQLFPDTRISLALLIPFTCPLHFAVTSAVFFRIWACWYLCEKYQYFYMFLIAGAGESLPSTRMWNEASK
jgi:hypothetical protein